MLTRCRFAAVASFALVSLSACDPAGKYVGSYNSSSAELTVSTRQVVKAAPVSVVAGSESGTVLINAQLPLPTPDLTPPSTSCAISAKANAANALDLLPSSCTVATPYPSTPGCTFELRVLSGLASMQLNDLLVNGSGTMLQRGCGQGGTDVSEMFVFRINAGGRPY